MRAMLILIATKCIAASIFPATCVASSLEASPQRDCSTHPAPLTYPILLRRAPCTQLIALLCPRPISSQEPIKYQRTELGVNLSVIRPVVIIIVGALVSRGVSTSGDIISVVRRPGQSVVHLVVVAPAHFKRRCGHLADMVLGGRSRDADNGRNGHNRGCTCSTAHG